MHSTLKSLQHSSKWPIQQEERREATCKLQSFVYPIPHLFPKTHTGNHPFVARSNGVRYSLISKVEDGGKIRRVHQGPRSDL